MMERLRSNLIAATENLRPDDGWIERIQDAALYEASPACVVATAHAGVVRSRFPFPLPAA